MQGVQFDLCVYAFVLDSIKYEMSKKDVSWTAKKTFQKQQLTYSSFQRGINA